MVGAQTVDVSVCSVFLINVMTFNQMMIVLVLVIANSWRKLVADTFALNANKKDANAHCRLGMEGMEKDVQMQIVAATIFIETARYLQRIPYISTAR